MMTSRKADTEEGFRLGFQPGSIIHRYTKGI
jgi:hypothetical protein